MRSTFHKLLTVSLLATYASISLLGEGLHWFLPDDCQHHGLNVVTCSTHDHAHSADCCIYHLHDARGRHTDHDHEPAGSVITACGCDTHSHPCEICEFLFHAVSQPPQVATAPDVRPLVADVPCYESAHYSPTALGIHVARGPPQLLA